MSADTFNRLFRIRQLKGTRRPFNTRPAQVLKKAQGAQATPTSPGNGDFGAVNGTQEVQNPFGFGSQSSANGVQAGSNSGQPASASFPPFGASSNSSGGFNFAPSNSGFNFSPSSNTSFNNPFASLNSGNTGASQSPGLSQGGGYQGSIFNIPPQAPSSQKAQASNAPFTFGQTTTNSQPSQQAATNPFAQSAPTQPSASSNISTVGKADNQHQASTSNIFGHVPTAPFGQTAVSQNQPTSSVFGQSGQSQAHQPASNLFGTPKPQQSQPTSNIFGSSTVKSSQAQSPESSKQSDDRMSTTPDTSPQATKQQQAVLNPFAFLNVPASPTPQRNTSESSKDSLFLPIPSEKSEASSQPKAGGSLFDRISKPDSPPHEVAKENKKENTVTEPPKNMFTGFSQPAQPTSSAGNQSPTKADQQNTKPLFAPFLPSEASSNTSSSNIFSVPKSTPDKSSSSESVSQIVSKAAQPQTFASPAKSSIPPEEQSQALVNISISDDGSLSSFDSALGGPPSFLSAANDNQGHSLDTQWRLKALERGIMKLFKRGTMSVEALMAYYNGRKQAIVDAAGCQTPRVAGGKRKLSQDEHDLNSAKKQKPAQPTQPSVSAFRDAMSKIEVNGDLVNGNQNIMRYAGYKSPTQLSSPTKRKADGDISKEADGEGPSDAKKARPEGTSHLSSPTKRKAEEDISKETAGEGPKGAQKARPEDSVTYPSLSSSIGSETSNIFKSIVNDEKREPPVSSFKQANGIFGASPMESGFGGIPSSSNPSSTTNGTPQKPTTALGAPKVQDVNPFASIAPISSSSLFSKQSSAIPSSSPSNVMPRSKATETTASPYTKPAVKTNAEPPAVKPPKFDTAATANFMSQFTKAAQKSENKEKEKRKAEDYDPDEDNEAEWERKYAEEQRAKKQMLEESMKGKATLFVPGKGFIMTEIESQKDSNKDVESDEASSKQSSRAPSVSVFDQHQKPVSNGLFSHLSDVDSGAEGSRIGDADDEETESEASDHEDHGFQDIPQHRVAVASPEKFVSERSEKSSRVLSTPKATESAHPSGGSLFDRISKDENGKVIRELPPAEEKRTSGLFGNSVFGKPSSTPSKPFTGFDFSSPTTTTKSNLFGQTSASSETAAPSDTNGSPGDHTWKTDSPIKFGATTAAPGVQVTSPPPAKNAFGGLFGSPKSGETTETSPKSTSSIFGTTSTNASGVGFGISFGSVAKPATNSLLQPSDTPPNDSSRATSPGISSAAENTEEGEGGASDVPQEESQQLDLTKGPGEEDEETLFEVKGKALTYDSEKKEWISKGVGPLRILKHPETGKSRILMRQNPSGKIALNAALLNGVDYRYVSPKSVRMPVAGDTGKLATYTVRVGKDEDAKRLAEVLEENKSN